MAIYYDPQPKPKSPDAIRTLTSYCTGGGFTDQCDVVSAIVNVLKPPPAGSYYVDLPPEAVVANMWREHPDGSVEIEVDLGRRVERSGVYTLVVLDDSAVGRMLSEYSLFE